MHDYRVVERWAEFRLCALRCSNGRYHVARVLNVMPPIDVRLSGGKPHLGFGVLMCPTSGALFRVIFESINEVQPVPVHVWMQSPTPTSHSPGSVLGAGGH